MMRPLAVVFVAWAGCVLAGEEAPADAWPMARGSLSGSGRSATTLRLPLTETWQRRLEKTAFDAPPVIAAGAVFVGDLDGTFHAFDLADGSTRWSFKTDAGFPSAAAASASDDLPLVVVGDAEGIVRAFDRTTGTIRWEYATEGEISGGPTIVAAESEERVLVGSQDSTLTCLSLADGALVWRHETADQIRCSPTVTAGGVLVAGCDGKLHVIDVVTGAEKAAVAIDGPTGTTPAARGGRAYFGTEAGTFFCIDVAAATVAWRVAPTTKGQSYRSSAGLSDSVAVVGSRGRALEAFALDDGRQRWRLPMRGRVDGSPLLARVDGQRLAAFVGDSAGRLLAVAAEDGSRLWEFDAGGGFAGGPAAAEGRLVAASTDGVVWCFSSAR
jgi:outer membrane protein assembly factor BamB